jgi:hypothetical protein
MGWNLSTTYASLDLIGIDQSAFEALLDQFAHRLWSEYQQTGKCPDHFDDLLYDGPSLEEAIPLITAELQQYLKDLEHSTEGTTVTIIGEYDTEQGDEELVKDLASFLFSHSRSTHFLLSCSAYDKQGGYAYQRIGYRGSTGAVVLESSSELLERIFSMDDPSSAHFRSRLIA